MSQFAREYPEDYEERWEAMLENADQLRKERRENPDEQAILDAQSEAELSAHLIEKHLGDPAYEGLRSPRAIRAQEARDRESDEMVF